MLQDGKAKQRGSGKFENSQNIEEHKRKCIE